MDYGYVLILLSIIVVALVFIAVKLAIFLKAFTKETQNICYEMERAENSEEYSNYHKQLRCHYLTLIPFITKKNAMRVYNKFFCKGERTKKEEQGDSLIPLIMPSVIGILICLFCICGMTWAWYSSSINAPTQKLVSAYYDVKVESITFKDNENVSEVVFTDGGYELKANTEYTITLKAEGTIDKCGGYCLIQIKETDGTVTKYYTQTIMPNDNITIRFKCEKQGTYTFVGVWGSVPTQNYLKEETSLS